MGLTTFSPHSFSPLRADLRSSKALDLVAAQEPTEDLLCGGALAEAPPLEGQISVASP